MHTRVLRVFNICAFLVLTTFLIISCGGSGGGGGGNGSDKEVNPSEYLFQGRVFYDQGISGQVAGHTLLDTEPGSSAHGVKVEIEGTAFSDYTDEQGFFAIKGISEGTYRVLFRKDENKDGIDDYGQRELIYIPGAGKYIEVSLHQAATLHGRATLEGAEDKNSGIIVYVAGSRLFGVTDDRGYFSIGGVSCGTALSLAAFKNCYAPAFAENLAIACGSDNIIIEHELVLEWTGCEPASPPSGAVKGHTFILGDTSHSGIEVTLSGGYNTFTDENGYFMLDNVPCGVYALDARKSDYVPIVYSNVPVIKQREFTVPDLYLESLSSQDLDGDTVANAEDPDMDNDGYDNAAEDIEDVQLCFSYPMGHIKGWVRDKEDSAPLNESTIGIAGTSCAARSDKEGYFEIQDIPVGTWQALAIKSDYIEQWRPVEILKNNTTEVVFELEKDLNIPPEAQINSPSSGFETCEGQTVSFSGAALDDSDPPENLGITWLSSINGPLNSDPAETDGTVLFSTDSLSPGTHLVTLRATDSGYLFDDDNVSIEITVAGGTENPILCLAPVYMDFGSTVNDMALELVNCGGGTLEWQAESDRSWLRLDNYSGSLAQGETVSASVSVDRINLLFFVKHSGHITFESNGGSNIVLVEINIPCGDFDNDGHDDAECGGTDYCDDDTNNWTASGCADCADLDNDDWYDLCDRYETITGPDFCDDDTNNWTASGCAECVDADNDDWYDLCDAYETITGPDFCDDDGNNWTASGCAECMDADNDGWYEGCDRYETINGPDFCDGDKRNWTEFGCNNCMDYDMDAWNGRNCDIPDDMCDDDTNNWTETGCSLCRDDDLDGYFVDCDRYHSIYGPDYCDDDPDHWTIEGCAK